MLLATSAIISLSSCAQLEKTHNTNKPNQQIIHPEKKLENKVQETNQPDKQGEIPQSEKKTHWDLPPSFTQKVALNTEKKMVIKPNLSGTWILNQELSDDPKEKLRTAMQDKKGSMGRGKGEGGGRGSGGRKGRGGESSGRSKNRGQRGLLKFALANTLILEHKEPLLIIRNERQEKQRVYTDFRTQSVSANGGINQKVVTASWEGEILIIETTSDTSPNMEQHFQLNEELNQLSVTTIIRMPQMDEVVSIYSVYSQKME